jgi:glycosyltransferase involved in cell wall biosynthesis
LKVAVDLHNLSTDLKSWRKTGIQEVVCHVLDAMEKLNRGQSGFQFFGMPYLPLKMSGTYPDPVHPVQRNNSNDVLKIVRGRYPESSWGQLGLDWNMDDEDECGEKFYKCVAASDWFLLTGLAEIRQIIPRVVRENAGLKIAAIVYDFIPHIMPEVTAFGMADWFNQFYRKSLERHVDLIISGSVNTAWDAEQYLAERMEPWQGTRKVIVQSFGSFLGGERDEVKGTGILEQFKLQTGKYFLCIGTIEPRKNLQLALDGFLKLEERGLLQNDDFKLVFVGKKGWGQGVSPAIESALDKEKIVFTGYLEDVEVRALLEGATCLLMPSRYEGYGIPIAMAHELGIPVVTACNSSLVEVGGTKSQFVQAQSADEMALILLEMQRTLRVRDSQEVKYPQWRGFLEGIAHHMGKFESESGSKNRGTI